MLLDFPALQTFVAAVDLGGFGKAAQRLHRTPGAISQQLKSLEDKVGQPLFRKAGRQQELTDAGELLLGFARRLLLLHDETLIALRGMHLDGQVRFGMPQDFADTGLPQTLAQFSRAHPAVRIDITIDRSNLLLEQIQGGGQDLVLVFADSGAAAAAGAKPLAQLPIQWLAAPGFKRLAGEPIPLLLLEAPCVFRQSAIEALDKAGLPWRVALTSGSVSGIWAAAAAGLGLTARTAVHVPQGLAVADKSLKLPALKKVSLSLHQDSLRAQPVVDHLRALVEEAVRLRLNAASG